MILFIKKTATMNDIDTLEGRLQFMGFETTVERHENQVVIAVINGLDSHICIDQFKDLPFVDKVMPFNNQFKLVGKSVYKQKTVIHIKDVAIGADEFVVMAGPCAIESREQIFEIAKSVSQAGARILRGGAFKPRTSPYDFQGLGEQGLQYMREAADAFGLLCVSEVMSTDEVEMVESYVDILQLGARNMQNYSLLKAVGKANKPVLLKRGLSATYKEFLSAAEYIVSAGNPNVILCERGIRTFETYSRNTLDIAAVPILRELTHLPIIVDPSHAVGLRKMVPPLVNAVMAVAADGVIVEVHTDPDQAISDAAQTISTTTFSSMMSTLRRLAEAFGRIVNQGVEHAV